MSRERRRSLLGPALSNLSERPDASTASSSPRRQAACSVSERERDSKRERAATSDAEERDKRASPRLESCRHSPEEEVLCWSVRALLCVSVFLPVSMYPRTVVDVLLAKQLQREDIRLALPCNSEQQRQHHSLG